MKFNYGKLPPQVLAELLGRIPHRDPRVVVGPRIGEDAAVIDFGDRYLVAKSDPITLATERIGWYAVQVNANDLATLGARPRWFLATLLLPKAEVVNSLAETIFSDILAACEELDVSLCGGHTEITPGLDRPIVAGHMLGEVEKERLVRKERIQPGDVALLTRGVALEGTAILAREKAGELAAGLEPVLLERARDLLFRPGISVVADALAAAGATPVHGMHDPTEGGLIGGLYELAEAAGCGISVERRLVLILPETEAICSRLGLDPLRLIASGALLIAAAPEDAPRIVAALAARGTPVAAIGRFTAQEEGLRLDGQPFAFPEFDEISRVL
jgi:hydrogenase expression/formation protein HypE